MKLTPEQIKSIQFIDTLIQPSTLTALIQNGSRQSWVEINNQISILKTILPQEEIQTTPEK